MGYTTCIDARHLKRPVGGAAAELLAYMFGACEHPERDSPTDEANVVKCLSRPSCIGCDCDNHCQATAQDTGTSPLVIAGFDISQQSYADALTTVIRPRLSTGTSDTIASVWHQRHSDYGTLARGIVTVLPVFRTGDIVR